MNESRLLQDITNQEQSLAHVLAHQSGKGHDALTKSARFLQDAGKSLLPASAHRYTPLSFADEPTYPVTMPAGCC